MLDTLTSARRLFVFKGATDAATIAEVAAQLRSYGPNWLLWVCEADGAHPGGSVERLATGLLRGFVSRFATYDPNPSLPVEDWVAVCANAYRLWRHAEPPAIPIANIISESIASLCCEWIQGDATISRWLDQPAPDAGGLCEHRLQTAAFTSVYRALLPIASGGDFAFSALIRIPEEFQGRQIGAALAGFSSNALWSADLKSRGTWQRIWVTATLPLDARYIACELLAEGNNGDGFQSACWCLEKGSVPRGYGFEPPAPR